MCTVSILPRAALAGRADNCPARLRVVCNRDEARARPAASAPTIHCIDGRQVAMPIDPTGGGSWIAANDRGMVFALLNANPGPFVWPKTARDPGSQPSRGLIITALAPSESVSDALGRARRLNAARFRPFRLLLLDSQQLIELWPDGARLRHRRALLQGPIMRTSSALGDVAVQAPRRALFRRMFNDTTHPCSVQDAFHEHQWPGAESISIRMERPDARTVSRTVVDVDHDRLRLSYCDLKSSTVTTVTLVVADSMRPSECS